MTKVVYFEDYYNTKLQDSALSGVIVTCTTVLHSCCVGDIMKKNKQTWGWW
jgi:hypothetical protein